MRLVIAIFATVTVLCGCASVTTVQEAFRYGAEAKFIFKVVDEEGVPVSNANARVGFYMPVKNINDMPGVTGVTDESGCFVAKEKTAQDVHYCFSKEGYYETNGDIFMKTLCPEQPIINGKWQPYGKEIKVVLKKKKNPIPMYVKPKIHMTSFAGLGRKGRLSCGYDLKLADWLPPLGHGKVADFTLTVVKDAHPDKTVHFKLKRIVEFSFSNKYDGFYKKNKDMFSKFASSYKADITANYQKNCVFIYDTLTNNNITDTYLKENEYLVLRTRSVVDEKGNLISANYTKIYGPINMMQDGLFWITYFNPIPNDINLECDIEKNLNLQGGKVSVP